MRAFLRFCIATLVSVLFVVTAPLALAHDELQASSPTADAVVQTSPDKVELTFNNDVMTMGAEFSVKYAEGGNDNFIEGEPQYHGKQVVQNLKSNLPQGTYNAAWRVVSSDGHPIGGVLKFSVGHKSQVQETTAPAQEATSQSNLILWISVGVAVLAVALVALWIQRRRTGGLDA